MSRVSSSTTQDVGRDVPWTQLYLGLSFTTLATLILELSLTRLFSVIFYYHFAFLAVSVAMFGLTVGALLAYGLQRNSLSEMDVDLGSLAAFTGPVRSTVFARAPPAPACGEAHRSARA